MIRNIGILAHVDAGKTTITEQLLYKSGKVRSLGRVDNGTASTDYLEVERMRGISVKAACTSFEYGEITVNLIDTPGHIDFASEVERSLAAMDGAILVISAVEGIQAHTEILWKALSDLKIPTIIFINKTDRAGADAQSIFTSLKNRFHANFLDVCDLTCGYLKYDSEHSDEALYEILSEHDDAFMERYLNAEKIRSDECYSLLMKQCRDGRIYPVLCGAAVKGIGIEYLIKAICDFCPPPKIIDSNEPCGVVFKLEHDQKMGNIAYVRLYGGELHNRDGVHVLRLNSTQKVSQIRKIYANKLIDVGELKAGDIGAVCGFNDIKIYDILGHDDSILRTAAIANALLKVRVYPESESLYQSLAAALAELSDEDPILGSQWIKDERELCINIMGTIQLEILGSILEQRYGLKVTFGAPSVIYKETLKTSGHGYVDYTMPKPCWAILDFEMEPLPRGSGVVFESVVRDDKIFYRYQNQVRQAIPDSLKQGMYGWEVTDIKIRLVGGEHHVEHTHPLDFIVATPMAIMDGLNRNGTTLLEPMIKVRISVPDDLAGKVIRDFIEMRGVYENPTMLDGIFTVEGRLPVAESLDYPQKLSAMSGGRGVLSMSFDGYEPCPIELGKITKRRGINPLDTAKYILYIRGALDSF